MADDSSFIDLVKEASVSFLADLARNRGNIRMLAAIFSYRVAHVASCHRKACAGANLYAIPIILLHRFLTEWVFGMDLPAATVIGKGLMIDHGYGLVINKHAKIGEHCRLRHSVTIGCKTNQDGSQGPSPKIGNYVDIGTGAILIGDIHIGDNAVIGAGAVVVNNVPSKATVVGNPAKVIRVRGTL